MKHYKEVLGLTIVAACGVTVFAIFFTSCFTLVQNMANLMVTKMHV